jgi:hypothetical protein
MGMIGKWLSVLLFNLDQTLWLMLTTVGLGACFVAGFWKLEQARIRWRERKAVGRAPPGRRIR